ncbi:serine/arginine repetitive matrix protein 2-like [Erinaceus europaeus]|uniref:Serine/arginine repetitive matrix protein 2-like n=1 Tax=Erinaceus europaeus TaxID=9365 RepID=A0ABM3XGJ8_ERIEU|nr:serine/arginine repetitive matrix protein 2-like [Erinaceus europaeus]
MPPPKMHQEAASAAAALTRIPGLNDSLRRRQTPTAAPSPLHFRRRRRRAAPRRAAPRRSRPRPPGRAVARVARSRVPHSRRRVPHSRRRRRVPHSRRRVPHSRVPHSRRRRRRRVPHSRVPHSRRRRRVPHSRRRVAHSRRRVAPSRVSHNRLSHSRRRRRRRPHPSQPRPSAPRRPPPASLSAAFLTVCAAVIVSADAPGGGEHSAEPGPVDGPRRTDVLRLPPVPAVRSRDGLADGTGSCGAAGSGWGRGPGRECGATSGHAVRATLWESRPPDTPAAATRSGRSPPAWGCWAEPVTRPTGPLLWGALLGRRCSGGCSEGRYGGGAALGAAAGGALL